MKTGKKTPTKTIKDKKGVAGVGAVSHRKNTTADTRRAARQRSGNNGPQQGSH